MNRPANDKRDVKMSYDLEFEKLLIMLKEQYHSLFDKQRLKMMMRPHNENNDDSESESDSDSENEQEQAVRIAPNVNTTTNSKKAPGKYFT